MQEKNEQEQQEEGAGGIITDVGVASLKVAACFSWSLASRDTQSPVVSSNVQEDEYSENPINSNLQRFIISCQHFQFPGIKVKSNLPSGDWMLL